MLRACAFQDGGEYARWRREACNLKRSTRVIRIGITLVIFKSLCGRWQVTKSEIFSYEFEDFWVGVKIVAQDAMKGVV